MMCATDFPAWSVYMDASLWLVFIKHTYFLLYLTLSLCSLLCLSPPWGAEHSPLSLIMGQNSTGQLETFKNPDKSL